MLLVADLLEDLRRVREMVRQDPWGLGKSLKPLMIDPLWRYIEAAGNTESRDAALALVEVAEDVRRLVNAGNMERAAWLADRFDTAAENFLECVAVSAGARAHKRQQHLSGIAKTGGSRAKRTSVRKLLVDAFTLQRIADPAMKKHDALVALKTSPADSLRVTKVADGWRIEDQDADQDAAEDLNEEQTKDLWKAAGQQARKKAGK